MRLTTSILALLLVLAGFAAAQEPAETRLLRYPDIHGDSIAFVYGGDIWIAGAQGGAARRLTSDPGQELFPKFSPDGRWIAFTGQLSGTRQVHVLSVDGGTARQLTFRNDIGVIPPRGGYDNQILDWTPDGKSIVFKANRTPYSERVGRPYIVPVDGGLERPLAIPEAGTGTLSPDGTKLVYTPIMREFRTWKRYFGGRAQDVWIYDLTRNVTDKITDWKGTDTNPVWLDETIYFVSDREAGKLNLYGYNTRSKAVTKATRHDVWDVLWPSGGTGKIVYESGGWIWIFDPASQQSRKVSIHVAGDLPHTLPYFKKVAGDIQSMGLSPSGKRALFGARGEVFAVPAEKGESRNLTRTPGIREMDATWSPDGGWVAYLSDRSGEYEIYVRPGDGTGEERRVTTDGTVWRLAPSWSPDSKKLAWGDKSRKLRIVDVATGKVTDADQDRGNDIADYKWSPDSRFLAYTKQGSEQFPSIWIYALDEGKAHRLTGAFTAEAEPTWDPEGRYLYFTSNRDYNLTFSGYEFDYLYTNPARLYVGILAKDGPALFVPKSDEEEPKKEEAAKSTAKEAKDGKGSKDKKADDKPEEKKPRPVVIDFEGFELRVRALPGAPGNYRSLAATAEGLFYITGNQGAPPAIKMWSQKDEKESAVLDGAFGFALSADGKKLLYAAPGDTYGVIDARPGAKPGDGKLDLGKLELQIQPKAEWAQMYVDAWRGLRDWFYDPAMHGTDWKALRERYGELVPHVATRADLDFILGELGAELSAGHVYVGPADEGGAVRVENGLLGAEVEVDASGSVRISRIFPGENWHQDFRSPLTEPGVDVKAGDYILAVDGVATNQVTNFYELLANKANRVVTLTVNGTPDLKGAREQKVRPVTNEQNLRYLEWVQANREKVDKASGGRIGYIHLPDTAVRGNRELFKYFYPQAGKEALIIDDRYNGGGFIPDRMVALLSRPLLNYWVVRGGVPNPTPGFVHTGPKATLINGQAGSGGDAFPYYFKKLGLGPLIGTATWGGLIGLAGGPVLLDGGSLSAPSYRFLTSEGEWAVENEGVAPDIEVVDRHDEVAKGNDPSLEKAIEVLLAELAKSPKKEVTVPPPPTGGAPR